MRKQKTGNRTGPKSSGNGPMKDSWVEVSATYWAPKAKMIATNA